MLQPPFFIIRIALPVGPVQLAPHQPVQAIIPVRECLCVHRIRDAGQVAYQVITVRQRLQAVFISFYTAVLLLQPAALLIPGIIFQGRRQLRTRGNVIGLKTSLYSLLINYRPINPLLAVYITIT